MQSAQKRNLAQITPAEHFSPSSINGTAWRAQKDQINTDQIDCISMTAVKEQFVVTHTISEHKIITLYFWSTLIPKYNLS